MTNRPIGPYRRRPPETNIAAWLSAIFIFYLIVPLPTWSNPPTPLEVKTALIIKFTDFVTWPDESFNVSPNHFVLGIIGKNSFKDFFNPFIGKTIQGRSFDVKYFDSPNTIEPVQILFIGRSEANRLEAIFSRIKGKNVLTIGEFDEFTDNGGILNLILKKGRVGFEINMDAVKRSHLKFSSHFLKLCIIKHDRLEQASDSE